MSAAPGHAVSWRGALACIALAVALAWPMLGLSAPIYFNDTLNYWEQGQKALAAARTFLSPSAAIGSTMAEIGETARALRSVFYSVFVAVTAVPAGLVGVAVLQTALVLFAGAAVIGAETRAPRSAIALALAAVVVLSPLPFYAALVMPDLLAAAVVLHAVVLVRGIDGLGRWQVLVLVLIAAFAVISHHGHLPLAIACTGAALAIRALGRRLTWRALWAGGLPIALAAAGHAALGAAMLDGPSVAPRRLPILLARSIADGPGRLYLEEACHASRYAVCEVFPDGIPRDIEGVLFDEGALTDQSAETLNRVRAEEAEIVWRAMLAHPDRQALAYLGNVLHQLGRIGIDDLRAGRVEWEGSVPRLVDLPGRGEALRAVADRVHPLSVIAAI